MSPTSADSRSNDPDNLPIRMISKVVPGFGRGSKDLGIPTANLSPSPQDLKCKISFDSLPTGIYYGFARLVEHDSMTNSTTNTDNSLHGVYKAAISIGYNPCYNNTLKTIEPHLIAPPDNPSRHISVCGETQFQDLYNETMRVSIVGYLRPELPFDGLDKLIVAIKGDIAKTEEFCDDESSSVVGSEREWVLSSSEIA
jgi:riboflavin kinase